MSFRTASTRAASTRVRAARLAQSLAEERITLTSRFSVFAALHNSESDTFENDDWRSPDAEWKNTFTASIVDFLIVNLSLDALYDREVDSDPRFRQTLSLGLTYRLL